ncbi:TPA: hypothetical protein GXZ54_06335 [bacterium]|jgi:hypothetical protein|nr:hypothetical protein [bacterium]
MNRSHKMQLEKLKAKNRYSKADLELAEELLKQNDPAFKKETKEIVQKIKDILNRENK